MATVIQTTNVHTEGAAIGLAAGDSLYIVEDVKVTSLAGYAVNSPGNAFIEVHGSVYGVRGINIYGSDLSSHLIIGREGKVSGQLGREAINIVGSHTVTNNGEVSVLGTGGWGIYTFGGGSITNTGVITAGTGVVQSANASDLGTHSFFNSGAIISTNGAYTGGGVASLTAINTGLMKGSVRVGGRETSFFDSHLGQVFGAITGGSGADTIYGGSNVGQVIQGNAGDDVLGGSAGADTIRGGDGEDAVSYRFSSRGMIIDLAVQAADDGDRLDSIENAVGSNFNDTVFGSDGDNVMEGGGGADKLNGYGGTDTVSYRTSSRGMIIDLAAQAANDGDTFIGVENVIGSDLDDTVFGSAGMNRIEGGEGNDRLSGFGGVDVLLGGFGDDVLAGGAGRDRLDGGFGTDTAGYQASTVGVIVDLAVQASSEGDSLSSIENVIGSAFDDTVFGSAADNVMEGGAGADRLRGFDGYDTVSYASSTRGMTASLATQTADDGDTFVAVEGVIGSAFNDVITGSAGSNRLQGGAGADQIVGGAEFDEIAGDAGADTLTGGADGDRFRYFKLSDSVAGAADRITDFDAVGGDALSLFWLDADVLRGGNQGFSIVSAFSYEAGQLTAVYDAASNTTTVSGDVNGDAVSDIVVLMTGDHSAAAGFQL